MTKYHLANIILIDDDSDDRQLFQDALTAVSPKSILKCFDNCKEVLSQLEDDTLPDVIFLDLMMPGVDGYECVRLIKQNLSSKDVPVVVLSGFISPANMDKLYDLGASFFIPKPPTFGKLKAVIDKMVNTPSLYAERSKASFFVNEYD